MSRTVEPRVTLLELLFSCHIGNSGPREFCAEDDNRQTVRPVGGTAEEQWRRRRRQRAASTAPRRARLLLIKAPIKVKNAPAARRGHGGYHVGFLAGLGYEVCMHLHRRRLVAIATALEK